MNRNAFSRNELFLQIFLFALFLAVSLPGIHWGTPNLWHPDEMVWRADSALGGELVFDESEPDFNYPSLPKYVMYGVGKIVYGLGGDRADFIVAARMVSALLGALSAVLIYQFAKLIGADAWAAALAALFYIAAGVGAENARFAHNDHYLQFFSILAVLFAVKYQFSKARGWLYASFFAVGLAASSKFTGGSLLLVPLIVFLWENAREARRGFFPTVKTILVGGLLSYGGYVLGTPKALLVAYYFPRVIPALLKYPTYGFNSGASIGLIGQWGVFQSAVGIFAYAVFILAFLWFSVRLLLRKLGKAQMEEKRASAFSILILTVLIFDLPFLSSINYIPRYFIPFVPFLSILGAFFVQELNGWLASKARFAPALMFSLLAMGFLYSFLRLAGVALLFMNDARIPAGEYIAALPAKGKIIEYGLYPPNVERKRFAKAYNYPIYFVKYATDVVPTGGRYEYNLGEAGLLLRDTDYLVMDSYTYGRFATPSVCATNPVECDFFQRLLAGEVSSFRLLAEFSYRLPPYLPQVQLNAVNPDVKIFERVR